MSSVDNKPQADGKNMLSLLNSLCGKINRLGNIPFIVQVFDEAESF